MSTAGWLPAPVEELFGAEAVAEESYEILTVDVPPTAWLTALETARDEGRIAPMSLGDECPAEPLRYIT